MNTSYEISPRVAEAAARDYACIQRAGMLPELRHEIRLSIQSHQAAGMIGEGIHRRHDPDYRGLDDFRNCDGWLLRPIDDDADELARLLQCEPSAVWPHLFELEWDGPTTRTIALSALRDVANRARNAMGMPRQAGRRSA